MTTTQRVKTQLASYSIGKLLDLRAETSGRKITPELAQVRRWLTDELEARNPEAFGKWLDDTTGKDLSYFFAS